MPKKLNPDYKNVETKAKIAAVVCAMADPERSQEEVQDFMFDAVQTIALDIVSEHAQMNQNDRNNQVVLASRGLHALTTDEEAYFNAVRVAMNATDPSLANLEVTMPKTEIDRIFEDLAQDSELLNLITFVPTGIATEWLVNKDEVELAQWGKIDEEITKKITSGFDKISSSMYSLTAYLPIARAMLDLGPNWLEKYIRTVLRNSIIMGCEKSYVVGDGKSQPIGMNRDLKGSVVDGVFPIKQAVEFNSITPMEYAKVLKTLCKISDKKFRKINEVILIVNPMDYLGKIFPSTTVQALDGTYKTNVFPFPTKIIESTYLEEGTAVIGLPKRYFANLGTAGSEGKIEFSDHFKFLQRERIYATFLYGNGMPLDNNAFMVLDISKLEPKNLQVELVNAPSAANAKAK